MVRAQVSKGARPGAPAVSVSPNNVSSDGHECPSHTNQIAAAPWDIPQSNLVPRTSVFLHLKSPRKVSDLLR
jgi:hypothetical protein